jgi:8-oxo-dGTP diphosphatase
MKRPNIQLTVDIVVFTIHQDTLKVLLIQRAIPPFEAQHALPGGFVLADETLAAAAFRELREETGTHDVYLEQLYTFGDPGRDPRGRVVTVAYYALVPSDRSPPLAFDHATIVDSALNRLRGKLEYTNVGFELLPRKFTLTALQTLHEAILAKPLDKRNFRRRILSLGLVKPTRDMEATGHRPARLYSFRSPA